MSHFLELIGIKPFKFARLGLTILVALCALVLIGALAFYISSWGQYGLQISLSNRQVRLINFNPCATKNVAAEVDKCVQGLIEKNKLSSFVTAAALVDKVAKFYQKQTSIKEELAVLGFNQAINLIYKNVDINEHYALTRIYPLFGLTKKDLCVIRSTEKDFQIKVLDNLSSKSAKERQGTYESFPSNQQLIHIFVQRQELLNKLYLDVESAFPASMLSRCKKTYTLNKKKIEDAQE